MSLNYSYFLENEIKDMREDDKYTKIQQIRLELIRAIASEDGNVNMILPTGKVYTQKEIDDLMGEYERLSEDYKKYLKNELGI